MKKLLFVAGLMLTSIGGALTAGSAASADDLGEHHPTCDGLVKDIAPGAPTPVAGNVYVKAGPVHYDVGFKAAGYIATPPGQHDVSHVDVCPTVPEVTTTVPEVTTTVPEVTTTVPEVTTTVPEVTTTVPEVTTTVPEVTTTVPEVTTTVPEVTTTVPEVTTTVPEVTTTVPEVTTTVPEATTTLPGLVGGDGGTVPTTIAPVVAGDSGTELPATGPGQTTGMAIMALGFLLTGLGVVAMTRRPEAEPLI